MHIPPISPNPSFPPGDHVKEAAELNQGIQDDLNELMSGKLSPEEERKVSLDLQQKSSSLSKLESTYPGDFTKTQRKTAHELQEQIKAMSDQMDPPSPGQLELILATSARLHF